MFLQRIESFSQYIIVFKMSKNSKEDKPREFPKNWRQTHCSIPLTK